MGADFEEAEKGAGADFEEGEEGGRGAEDTRTDPKSVLPTTPIDSFSWLIAAPDLTTAVSSWAPSATVSALAWALFTP